MRSRRSPPAALVLATLVVLLLGGCGEERMGRDTALEQELERKLGPALDDLERRMDEAEREGVRFVDDDADEPEPDDAPPTTR